MEKDFQLHLSFIKSHHIFAGMDEKEISTVLSHSEFIKANANDYLIREGEHDKRCYLVLSGELEVIKSDEEQEQHRLAVLSRGDFAGGIVMLDDLTRSASVRCLTDCELMVLDQKKLEALIQADRNFYRLFKNFAAALCNDFRESNEVTIRALKDKIKVYQMQVSMSKTMVTIILSLCFISFYNLIASRYVDAQKTNSYLTAMLLVFMVVFLVIVFRAVKLPLSIYGLTLSRWKPAFWGGVIYSIPICVIAVLIKWVLIHSTATFAGQDLFPFHHARFEGQINYWLIDTLVYGILLCPFQELLARSGLQAPLQYLLTGRFRITTAILVSNTIFMTAHLFHSVYVAVMVFVPGLFFGWLFYKYNSLVAPITSHIIVGVWAISILGLL